MVDTTANQPTGTYDEYASPGRTDGNSDRHSAADADGTEQLTFRLEIVLVSGREGEKLQAIQARAIREALLWAVQRDGNGRCPGEGGDDGHDD